MFTTKISTFRNVFRMVSKFQKPVISACSVVRCKYDLSNKGVKGGNQKKGRFAGQNEEDFEEINAFENASLLDDRDYDSLANTAMHVVTDKILNKQNVFLIQPYVKWGQKRSPVRPELQLEEAESLIRSLPNWQVANSLKVPVEGMDKRMLFGSGKLEEIRELLKDVGGRGLPITCMFISKSTLTYTQKSNLEEYFKLPVMDRYSVVIQILRLHATSQEAKLQVAMAELPYIWMQMRDVEMLGGVALKKQKYYLTDQQKAMLKQRERKIKHELLEVRAHRELLRNKRKQKNFPIIAIVGYTNAGKTSLIKALTDEQSLVPKNQLFATLDVTAHAGFLPSKLEVLYMDTVGFMSDIPTGLIECFVATLEDALEADIIVHVQDVSHENYLEQKNHVETTLASLIRNNTSKTDHIMDNVVNVGNKVDLVPKDNLANFQDLQLISSTTLIGINDLLVSIEGKLLTQTNRQKIIIRVPMGGEEMQWLYKNSAVTESAADPEDSQQILMSVVIHNAKLQQFKHHFVKSKQ